ncbi:MAG: hypothetical protein MZV65_00225, partial [Chromatiales bacterium]|nr:hypothetical protein [Chromatiales bacterium]
YVLPRLTWQLDTRLQHLLDHVTCWVSDTCAASSRSTSSTTPDRGLYLSLGKDAPEPRAVQGPHDGQIIALLPRAGLHHHYTRHAA